MGKNGNTQHMFMVFLMFKSRGKGVRGPSGVSFKGALILVMGAPPSRPNYPSKTHFLTPSSWRLGPDHRNLGWGTQALSL